MATAFVTTMQLQKTVGTSVKHSVHAQMAARAGLLHAIGKISKVYGSTTYDYMSVKNDPSGQWCWDFHGTDVVGLLTHIYSNDPYYHNPGSYDGGAKWFTIDMGDYTDTDVTKDDKYSLRYAVATIDLNGRFFVDATESVVWKKRFASMISHGLGGADFTNTYAAMENLFAAQAVYSWDHARSLAAGLPGTDPWTMVSPFGSTAAELLGSIHSTSSSPINLNTAPLLVKNAMLIYLWSDLAAGGDTDFGIDSYDSPPAAVTLLSSMGTLYGANDTDNFTDLFGDTYGTADATDFRIDLANAMSKTLQTFDIGAADYPCETVSDFVAMFKQYMEVPADTWYAGCPIKTINEQLQQVEAYGSDTGNYMETALNDTLASFFGPNCTGVEDYNGADGINGGTATTNMGEFYIGKSNYFYIVVRGQALRNGRTVGEGNLEAAVYIWDNAGVPSYDILYQRWFD